MTGIIYRAYLPSGISYIGQTINLDNRKKNHWSHRNDSELFHIALRLFGKEQFNWEILEECNVDELDEKEKYWVFYFESNIGGFNRFGGGNSCPCKTQSSISNKKRSKSLKGKEKKARTRKLLSTALIGNKNGAGNKGRKHSEKQNSEHAEALRGRHRVYHPDGTWHMEK